MALRVAIYETAKAPLAPRLAALGVEIELLTWDRAGRFRDAAGAEAAPAAAQDIDVFWMSQHAFRDDALEAGLTTAQACRSLRLLQTSNAGLDHPAYRPLIERGVRICNSSAQGVAIAEYVIGQTMAVLQPIEAQRALQARREWGRTPFREISGTTWLIVGFGPIGSAVAQRVKAFGAKVMAARRSGAADPAVDRMGVLADLPGMLAEADVIVLACPLNAATAGLADAAFFAAAKPGAILVNVARGGVVDDAALLAALDEGRLETAILDVFHTEPLPADDPLWSHPGVRLTAHTSFNGDGTEARWNQLFLDNLVRLDRGEALVREVDRAIL